jgi:hypothetical protein
VTSAGRSAGPIDYSVAVATNATALDYVSGGMAVTPEPNPLILLAGGLPRVAGVAATCCVRLKGRDVFRQTIATPTPASTGAV